MAKYTVCLDLGSKNISAGLVGGPFAVTIPSIVATSNNNQVVAVGVKALSMPANTCKLVAPILEGAIIDTEGAKALIEDVMFKVLPSKVRIFGAVNVVCAIPCAMISSDKKSIESALLTMGVQSVKFVESALASSVALFQEFAVNRGLVVNIGRDCADFAVVFNGNIISGCTLYCGGKALTNAICDRVKQKYLIQLKESQAESFKLKCASLHANDSAGILVTGTNVHTNNVETIDLTSREMYDTMVEFVKRYCTVINSLLGNLPDQISQSVKQAGVLMCGGGSQLVGIDYYIHSEIGLPVRVSKDCCECAINGLLSYCSNHSDN